MANERFSLAPTFEKVPDHHFYLKEGVKGYGWSEIFPMKTGLGAVLKGL